MERARKQAWTVFTVEMTNYHAASGFARYVMNASYFGRYPDKRMDVLLVTNGTDGKHTMAYTYNMSLAYVPAQLPGWVSGSRFFLKDSLQFVVAPEGKEDPHPQLPSQEKNSLSRVLTKQSPETTSQQPQQKKDIFVAIGVDNDLCLFERRVILDELERDLIASGMTVEVVRRNFTNQILHVSGGRYFYDPNILPHAEMCGYGRAPHFNQVFGTLGSSAPLSFAVIDQYVTPPAERERSERKVQEKAHDKGLKRHRSIEAYATTSHRSSSSTSTYAQPWRAEKRRRVETTSSSSSSGSGSSITPIKQTVTLLPIGDSLNIEQHVSRGDVNDNV